MIIFLNRKKGEAIVAEDDELDEIQWALGNRITEFERVGAGNGCVRFRALNKAHLDVTTILSNHKW
jgi:hypothetical protein